MTRARVSRLAVILLPAILQALVVAYCAVPVQSWDELTYTQLLRDAGEGRPWLRSIWTQHNEHRIVWTKLLILAHAPFTSWNPNVEMYVSAALVALIAWGLWKLYAQAGGERAIAFLPVSLLLCSLAQYMNMLDGFMNCHYFGIAGMVWSLVFLMRGSWRAFWLAVAAGAFAMLSILTAIVLWPAGLVVLLLSGQSRARKALWIAAAVAIVALTFAGYHRAEHLPPIAWSLQTVKTMAMGMLMSLGAPFAAGSSPWAVSLGFLIVVLTGFAIAGMARTGQWREHAAFIGLMCMGAGCAALIAIGRHQLGLEEVFASRYVSYLTLLLIGCYLTVICQRDHALRTSLIAATATLFLGGWIAANVRARDDIRAWASIQRTRRYLLQTVESQPPEKLISVFFANRVRDVATYLRAKRLGPFREHVDALLPARSHEGVLTASIGPGAELHTKFLCPVDTLRDVDVFVTREFSKTQGTLHVSLESEQGIVAQRSVDVAPLLGDHWISLALPKPVSQCRFRPFALRVSFEGEAAVHAWTYPTYYGGVTRFGPVVIPQRDLGIAFNGSAAELLP